MNSTCTQPSRDQRRSGGQAGFTLIEMLVVIGLIGLLSVAFLPDLLSTSDKAARTETMARMQHLRGCIEAFQRKQRGVYPPDRFSDTYFKRLKVRSNGVNEGIESLVAHLHFKSLGGTWNLMQNSSWLGNTDKDDGMQNLPVSDTSKLMEVKDTWNNPIVYFQSDSYGTTQKVKLGTEDGEVVDVQAVTMPNRPNRYLGPNKYQLISAGPDMVFGTEDDVTFPERPLPEPN